MPQLTNAQRHQKLESFASRLCGGHGPLQRCACGLDPAEGHLKSHLVFLTDMPTGFGQCLECHIEGRFATDTYAYRLEFSDEEEEEEHLASLHHLSLGFYAVALRKVPPHLVVSCNLDIGTFMESCVHNRGRS